jgi:hypothetical protein
VVTTIHSKSKDPQRHVIKNELQDEFNPKETPPEVRVMEVLGDEELAAEDEDEAVLWCWIAAVWSPVKRPEANKRN